MQSRSSILNVAKFTYTQLRACSGKRVFSGERSVNQVTLLGRVGSQPVCRGTSDHPVTMFQVATSYSVKLPPSSDDQQQYYEQRTQWHRVSVFRKGLRDVAAAILNKGDRVYVTGNIEYSSFTDAATSHTTYTTTIVADNMIKLNAKSASNSSAYPYDNEDNQNRANEDDRDTMEYTEVQSVK